MIEPAYIHRMLLKLEVIKLARPTVSLGALIEAIEDLAWDSRPTRHCSARLMHMDDWLFEYGMDLYMKANSIVVPVTGGWLS